MKRFFYGMFLLFIAVLGLLSSCGGGDGDSEEVEPTLSTSKRTLQFESTKGNQQSFSVSSNVDWTVLGYPDWLSLSCVSGTSGTTTVTATTTVSNEESVDVQGKIQIRYGNGQMYEITVVQASSNPGIYAELVDEKLHLALTYGFSCRVGFGPNTTQAYWNVYTEEEYQRTSESTLEQNHRSWSCIRLEKEINTTVDTSTGKTYSTRVGAMSSLNSYYMDFSYFQCKPKTTYKLVIYPYGNTTSKQGKKLVLDFTTQSTDQPIAKILAESFTVDQTEQKYKWKIEKNTSCGTYYTYVCKSSKVFTSYTLAEKLSSDASRRGTIMTLYMKTESLNNQTELHTFSAANKGCSGCTEYFFVPGMSSGTQEMSISSGDKYIEIITWGADANGNLSGILSDEIFDVDAYKETYDLSADVTSLSFTSDAASKTISITGTDSWTCSSNQSWCTVSKSSGTGAASITVSAAQNTSTSSRNATITIKGTNSGKSITVSVSQSGADYTLSVSVASLSFTSDAASKTITITGTDSWTCSSNQSWCTVSKSSGTGAASITVSAAQNTSTSSRNATITIKGTNTGKSTTVSVVQSGKTSVTNSVTIDKEDYESDKPLDGVVITKDDYDNDKQL